MDNFNIIPDGSNVAFHRKTHKKKAKFQNLVILKKFLKDLKSSFPIDWEIAVDASLRHKIDDKKALEQQIQTGAIIQCPKKTKADEWILDFFKRHPENTLIISNDEFEEYSVPNLVVFKYSIFFGEIMIRPDLHEYLKTRVESLHEVEHIG